jgi:hypothetical protein
MRSVTSDLRRWLPRLVLAGYGILLVLLADTRIQNGLDSDRYAFMESLVERGELTVDHSSMQSVDRIRVAGHFRSGKPPILNFLGAGVYAALHHGLGWSFRTRPSGVVRVLIAVFVVVPVCILLWFFGRLVSQRRLLQGHEESPWFGRAAAVAGLLAIGSLLLPYSLIFTNHPLAAALLFGALFVLVGRPKPGCEAAGGEVSPAAWAAVGLLGGLSVTIDLLPGTVFLLALLVHAAATKRFRALAAIAAGAAVPALVHLVLNRLTLGTWVVSYFIKDAFNYEGSVWSREFTGASDYDQFPTYASGLYHFTLGHRGVFLFMPLLLAGIFGAVGASRRFRAPEGAAGIASVSALVGTILLVPKFSWGLGGCTYGPRHIVPCIALLYAFLPDAFRFAKTGLLRFVSVAAAAWSVLIALLGVLDPWAVHVYSVYAPLDVIVPRAAFAGEGGRRVAEWIVERTAASPSFGYYELGRNYGGAGQTGKAIECLVTSLAIDSTRTLAWYQLGFVAGKAGDLELAASAFRRLTMLEPDHAGAWSNLGLTLQEMGLEKDAKGALERGLQLNPESRAARVGLARVYRSEGNTTKVEELLSGLPPEDAALLSPKWRVRR